MSSDRHDLVGRLFAEGLSVPATERADWLESLDVAEDVIAEVSTLLSVDESEVPFLDDLPAAATAPSLDGFDLEEIIGRGGMGVVWAARQKRPERRVAIKVLASTLVDTSLQRFRRETDALGRLEHDAIARVYDAGVSDGRPYIVMELVEGVALDARAGADVEILLRLFVEVCEGVAHAHGRGIIHRDLKPANILVTATDQPKILDFGIARVLDDSAAEATLQTRTGMVLGTLPYMSPEQARGEVAAVDVRSDVYSLGVMLFELLEGRRPIDVDGLPLSRAVQRICDVPAPALGRTGHRFDRDLGVIVAKALAKEPERRYDTAAALVDDLERLLADEPILARPPSAAYVAARFARRHRVAVAAAAVTTLALIVATVVSLRFAFRVREANTALARANTELDAERGKAVAEAERADKEARTANAFVMFVFDTLLQEDPTRDGEPSLRAAIERVAGSIDSKFDDFPVIRARLHRFVGRMYEALGRPEKAIVHLNRAFALYLEHAPGHADATPMRAELAHQQMRAGRAIEAKVLIDEYLDRLEADGLEESPEYGRGLDVKTEILLYLGRADEARAASVRALGIFEQAGDAAARESCLYALAGALMQLGDLDGSRERLEELVALRRARLPADHPYVAEALSALGSVLLQTRKLEEAVPILAAALSVQQQVLGPDHSVTTDTMRKLALAREISGDLAGALIEFEEILELRTATHGDDGMTHAISRLDVGRVKYLTGDFAGGREDLEAAIAIFESVGPTAHVLDAWFYMSDLENRAGRMDVSADWALRGTALAREQLPPATALFEYLNAAARRCHVARRFEDSSRLFAEMAPLIVKGFGSRSAIENAQNLVWRGEALLLTRGADAAEDLIEEGRDLLDELEAPAATLRNAIEIEIRLRRQQRDPDTVRELRAALAAIEEDGE